jgi:hypothetical protein
MLWLSMSLSNKANGRIPWTARAVQATTVESTVSKAIGKTGLLCLPQLQHPLAVLLTMTYGSNDKGGPPPASPRSRLVKVNRQIDTCKQPLCHPDPVESASWARIGPKFQDVGSTEGCWQTMSLTAGGFCSSRASRRHKRVCVCIQQGTARLQHVNRECGKH